MMILSQQDLELADDDLELADEDDLELEVLDDDVVLLGQPVDAVIALPHPPVNNIFLE